MSIPPISNQPITQSPTPPATSLLRSLPIAVTAKIYAFAGPRDTSTCTTVSRQVSEDAVECARITIQEELNRFINGVEITVGNQTITDKLKKIGLLSTHKFPTLLSLKTTVFDIKYAILNVMQDFTPEQLYHLRELSKPTFCEDILRLAAIRYKYREHKLLNNAEYGELIEAGDLQKACEFAALNKNNSVFEEIFKRLLETNGFLSPSMIMIFNKKDLNNAIQKLSEEQLEKRDFSKAIQALNMIPDKEVREKSLQGLCITFAKEGQLDWAIKTAKNIRNKVVYALAIRDICIVLTEKGKVEEATSLAATLLTDSTVSQEQSNALSAISQTLAKTEQFSAALEIARSIKHELARSNALYSLSECLVEKGQILHPSSSRSDFYMGSFGALSVAKMIPDESRRDAAYLEICKFLAGENQFPESIEVAEFIQAQTANSLALYTISTAMTLNGQVEEAYNLAQKIPQIEKRDMAYLHICLHLAKKQKFPKSIAIAGKIENKNHQDKAWLNISQEMLNDNLLFPAAQIAARIQHPEPKLETLEKIYKILVVRKSWDQAIAVANLIPMEEARKYALQFISDQQRK